MYSTLISHSLFCSIQCLILPIKASWYQAVQERILRNVMQESHHERKGKRLAQRPDKYGIVVTVWYRAIRQKRVLCLIPCRRKRDPIWCNSVMHVNPRKDHRLWE